MSNSEYDKAWIEHQRARVVVDSNGCWLWQGCINKSNRYGIASYHGHPVRVHRKMYELVSGLTLPAHIVVCHKCDVRHCCNPDHLWPGTVKENTVDAVLKGRHQETRKTCCERGHEYTPENTKREPGRDGRGRRKCRICLLAYARIAAGWPIELAYSAPLTPRGYRVVNTNRKRKLYA